MRSQESEHNLAIAAVADLLANCHDWYVENLPMETDEALQTSSSALSPEIRSKILKSFFAIPLTERMSPDFDHFEFVRKILRDKRTS